MVAAMKIISLSFDIERSRVGNIPSPLEVWGYIMCPGNIIMGPWCSYSDYLQIYHKPRWVRLELLLLVVKSNRIILINNMLIIPFIFLLQPFKWHAHILVNFCLSILFLLASNCLVMEFIPNLNLRWALLCCVHFKVILYTGIVFSTFYLRPNKMVWECQEHQTSPKRAISELCPIAYVLYYFQMDRNIQRCLVVSLQPLFYLLCIALYNVDVRFPSTKIK